MPKTEILRILQAVQKAITENDVTDEEAQALLIAAAKSTRRRRRGKEKEYADNHT